MTSTTFICGEKGEMVPMRDIKASGPLAPKSWTEHEVRQLICIVKLNLGLYAKNQKIYKDKMAKEAAWNSVGLLLAPQCSGVDAAAKFKALRDTFTKEHKKANPYIPSGSGAVSPAQPTWQYYTDLLFLKDHILTRKTTSSTFVRNEEQSPSPPICIPPANVITLDQLNSVLQGLPTPSVGHVVPELEAGDACSQEGSILETLEFVTSPAAAFAGDTMVTGSGSGDGAESEGGIAIVSSGASDKGGSSTNSSTGLEGTVVAGAAVSLSESGYASPSTSNLHIRAKAARSIMAGTSRLTPLPNLSKRARKDSEGDIDITRLTNAAESMANIVMSQSEKKSTKVEDPCAGMVSFAMSQLPQEKKTQCVIDVLQVIEMHRNGMNVSIQAVEKKNQ